MTNRNDVDGGGFLEEKGIGGGGGVSVNDKEGGLEVVVEDQTVGQLEEGN